MSQQQVKLTHNLPHAQKSNTHPCRLETCTDDLHAGSYTGYLSWLASSAVVQTGTSAAGACPELVMGVSGGLDGTGRECKHKQGSMMHSKNPGEYAARYRVLDWR